MYFFYFSLFQKSNKKFLPEYRKYSSIFCFVKRWSQKTTPDLQKRKNHKLTALKFITPHVHSSNMMNFYVTFVLIF